MPAKFCASASIRRFNLSSAWLALASVLVLGLAGCGSNSGDPSTQLQRSSVTNTGNPLVAQFSATTSGAGTVTIQFGTDTNYGFQTASQDAPSSGGTLNFLVAGMKQNTLYHMRAVLDTTRGTIYGPDQTFTSGAIPSSVTIPAMDVTTGSGQQPTAGVQLVSAASQEFAINTAGDVIWYYQNNPGESPLLTKLLPNGDMIIMFSIPGPPTTSGIREVDLAGNTVREVDQADLQQKLQAAGYNINVLSIDHDVLVLPNGHWVFIVTDNRVFTDLPGYPGQTTVIGSVVVDVDQNNNPTWVWNAFDHLDVNRHPMLFPDWTHANALFYIPDDGSLLLSLRHQHWILKLDYQNGSGAGDVIWKLGHEGDFTLQNSTSPADWFYAQHDANIASSNLTGDIQLAIWDNGNYRVLDDSGDTCDPNGTPLCYSTATIFDVNENTMTASRQWSYQTVFSYWGGSTQLLSNNHVLFNETAPSDLNGSRAIEVSQAPNPPTVWQVQVHNMSVYRMTHLGSLYPNVQW